MFRIGFFIAGLILCVHAGSRAQVVTNMYDTLCSGDALFGYNATGVYRDTFRVTAGDSIRVLNLRVIPRVGASPLPRWFNTGTNGAGGRLPGGGADLNWEVSSNQAGPYVPAVVMSAPPPNYSSSIWPDCAWISHNGNGSHSSNVYYYYRIDFDLPCFDSCGSSFNSDSTFCLTLDLLVDNSIYEVFVNNVPQSSSLGGIIPVSNPYGNVGFQNANKIALVLCKGWKRGYNSVIIQIASGCCNAGFLAQASVNAPPPPPVVRAGFDLDPLAGAGSSPDTGCAPYTMNFVNNSTAATDYLWDFGDGSPIVDSISPTHTYLNPGVYNIILIAQSTFCGNQADTIRKTITVYDYPVVNLGPDTGLCGDAILLQSSPALAKAGYLWSSGATTPSYSATATGIYWLDVDQHGCVSRDSIAITMYPDLTVDLGRDTGICDRDVPFLLYSSQPAGIHYLWSNGLSDTQLMVTRSGRYWLEVSQNGCTGSDTIYVTVVPTPSVDLGADSIICEQFPLSIGLLVPGAKYTWSTGAATSHISVNTTGDYILTINLNGCMVQDTISLTAMPVPEINLGPDRDICPEQTIVLDATYGTGSRYLWNTGAATSAYNAEIAGLYHVTVTSEDGCIGHDSVLLTYYPKPTIFLGADTSVCEETPLLLRPWFINTDSVRWSDGSINNEFLIRLGGEYIVTGINKCGTGSDTIQVKQVFCDIWMPNAFTPNGDGGNDVLRALGNIGRLEGFRFSVFNRWGQQVFHTKDKLQGWDGMHNGGPAVMGTYVYMLEYSLDGKPYMRKGNVHLLR